MLEVSTAPLCEFPAGTEINYLFSGALSFGCVMGTDTLVSEGQVADLGRFGEFNSYDTVHERSSAPSSRYYNPLARADQEYFAVYSDTAVWMLREDLDEVGLRPHRPIGLEVHQTSYAWSGGVGSNFVIIDNWIKNISSQTIREGCVSLTIVPMAQSFRERVSMYDVPVLTGFLPTVPAAVAGEVDTVNMAWSASPNGRPLGSQFTPKSPRGVMGVRILRAPSGGRLAYNWWAWISESASWGPRLRENILGFFGSLGQPVGDRGRYQMMTNGEIDYDQVYAAIDRSGDGWSPPFRDGALMRRIAGGALDRYMLSVGPIEDIAPGDSVPFTYALISGDNFHRDPRNFIENFDPMSPKPYMNYLDFSDLITSARWADWVFDNPGVDTDGDGYRGKFYLVNCRGPLQTEPCDTLWYKGDGVPDFRNLVAILPAPPFTLTTRPHEATLRWTGATTETARGAVSRRRDFEGYRVYTSRFDVAEQYSLVASWDTDDDFTRWAYQPQTNDWRQVSYPLTVGQWQQAMGDAGFDPKRYPHPSFESAYRDTVLDTVLDLQGTIIEIKPQERYSYWEPQGPNRGNRFWTPAGWEDNLIQRVGQRDTVIDHDTLTYGLYEITISNLNGAIPLYFAVTTFDYGDYKRNVASQESSPHANNKLGFLVYSSNVVVDSGLQVAVYPNPYKISFADPFGDKTSYYRQRYEAPGQEMTERDRRIWFVNLPDTARIRIYTLAGDLVRDIRHPDPFLTTYPSIVGWDLVSRNTQAVVSGIYIYRVDSRLGRQVGKIVIIK